MQPRVCSEWTRIVECPANHLNDFCLFQDLKGRWHCLGIMGTGSWSTEVSFLHGSSVRLPGRFELHDPILTELDVGDTVNCRPQKHAPFVVTRENLYYLFFRRPPGTNLMLKSNDLFHWPKSPVIVFEENDARDACIREFGGVYHWYYCQWREIEGVPRSTICLRRSRDLEKWSEPTVVHFDTSREVSHCHLESPSIVNVCGTYWLFIRDRSRDERCVTTVFRSDRPDSFPSGETAWEYELENVHAPEIVQADGTWYLARVSGPPDHLTCAPRTGGWLEVAELAFEWFA